MNKSVYVVGCHLYANTNGTFKLEPLTFTLCGCSNIETFGVFDSIFIGFRFYSVF